MKSREHDWDSFGYDLTLPHLARLFNSPVIEEGAHELVEVYYGAEGARGVSSLPGINGSPPVSPRQSLPESALWSIRDTWAAKEYARRRPR